MKKILKQIIVYIITLEAKAVLKKYKPRVVAITGSVGKTSTKESIACVLSSKYRVAKSEKSYNSEIGVPLSVLQCENAWSNVFGWLKNIWKGFVLVVSRADYPEWLVLELGVDKPGDMERLTAWIKPDVVVVTRFGKTPVHIEFFSSRDELIAEKAKLVKALKEDGTLVLNYDDKEVADLRRYFNGDILYYGLHSHAHVYGSNEKVEYDTYEYFEMPAGISFKVNSNGSSVPINLRGCLGIQHIYPVLASFAVCASLNMNMITVSQVFSKYNPPAGRMRLLPGIKKTMIIDDSYNSSPVATEAALDVLKNIKVPYRRVAVLGDLRELGEESENAHLEAGRKAAEVCDVLLTVGELAKGIARGAVESGMRDDMVRDFLSSAVAGEALEHIIEPGDVVLIKGSQAVRCEKVVEEIMNEPDRAEELLVRQDAVWKGER